MKTSIAITLITLGGLLMVSPVLALQRQVQRAATYYEQHGTGSTHPEEMRPQPHSRYDWASLAAGTAMALLGVAGSMRSRAFTRVAVPECHQSESTTHQVATRR
jgi:hypothetical protein